MLAEQELKRRRVPCLITFLSPFRMVEAAGRSQWQASIDEVNSGTWDYTALHEIVGRLNVGLDSPYDMIVARDGALALPPIPRLRSDTAVVEFFNRCLAALLIGGVYCEAITLDGLDLGSMIDWKYVRSHQSGLAAPNRFHNHVRLLQSSALEAIALFEPPTVSLSSLSLAMKTGLSILDQVPTVRGEYLLRGVTGIARRDWGTALANLWIVVEQLISVLWQREVVAPTQKIDGSKERRAQLGDSRTWTISTRIEMLFQKNIIDSRSVKVLSLARRVRNNLVHQGEVTAAGAQAAYEGVCMLFTIVLNQGNLPLLEIDLTNHSISDPFAPRVHSEGEPTHWMDYPRLPGELELEKAEIASLATQDSADNRTHGASPTSGFRKPSRRKAKGKPSGG